jgi:hypothetical protein
MQPTDKDSESNTSMFSLSFERGTGKIAQSLVPVTDEPICVYYFPGGWEYGYPAFHVIIEYGDIDQVDYLFLSLDEMCKRFGVSEEIIMAKQSIIISQNEIKENPNDSDFGRFVRSKFTK